MDFKLRRGRRKQTRARAQLARGHSYSVAVVLVGADGRAGYSCGRGRHLPSLSGLATDRIRSVAIQPEAERSRSPSGARQVINGRRTFDV